MLFGIKFSSLSGTKARRKERKADSSDWERPAIDVRHSHKPSGFFAGSSNVTLYHPILVDNSQYIINDFDSGVAVLNTLEPFTTPEAAMDSSARDPPPRCHPGTRAQLHGRLQSWLVNNQRPQNMIWLRGPAGSGKSAVAQTFAEHADSKGRLGAAFFFSRPNKRHKPLRLVPTLSYQLALHRPDYRALLTRQLVNNPLIPKAALYVQFKKLIAEPFSILVQSLPSAPEPLLMVLDGLDECEGEDAQCEIIKIISEAAHPENNLPFLWLLCSRPEPHIVFTFSTVDASTHIAREQIVFDIEARNDVDRCLRDELGKIRAKYSDVVIIDAGQSWPLECDFDKISNAAAGLFVFASTVLKYIGDPEYANPNRQLRHLLACLANSQTQTVGMKSPWESLDRLYTRILSDIPDHILPTTMRILGLCLSPWARETQACCNFLTLEAGEFYTSLRRLHAVMVVPPPHEAFDSKMSFHHASFKDYLQDRSRSGKYFIDEQLARAEIVKSSLHWVTLPEVSKDFRDPGDVSAYVPHLPWVSPGPTVILVEIVLQLAFCCLTDTCMRIEHPKEISDSVSLISQRAFTNSIANIAPEWFIRFMSVFYRKDKNSPENGIVWTEVGDAVDAHHLQSLSILAGYMKLEPAPLSQDIWGIENKLLYFFHGTGPNRCVACYIIKDHKVRCCILRGGSHFSEDEGLAFRRYMLSASAMK